MAYHYFMQHEMDPIHPTNQKKYTIRKCLRSYHSAYEVFLLLLFIIVLISEMLKYGKKQNKTQQPCFRTMQCNPFFKDHLSS